MTDGYKKHILGIAIFLVVIVAFGKYSTTDQPPHSEDVFSVPPERLHYNEVKVPKKFNAYLNSIEYDQKSRRFTAQLDLEWDGTLPSPRELNLDIRTITEKESSIGHSIYRFAIVRPFKEGVKRTIDLSWKDEYFLLFDRDAEHFAFVEIEPWNDTTKLLYVERNFMLNAVPLRIKRSIVDRK